MSLPGITGLQTGCLNPNRYSYYMVGTSSVSSSAETIALTPIRTFWFRNLSRGDAEGAELRGVVILHFATKAAGDCGPTNTTLIS